MYVDSVSDAVLKGMGEQLYSMKINIADAAISVLAVFLLVPKIGIVGYVIAIYLSEGFNTCASMLRVIQLTKSRMPVLRFVISPLLLSVAAANLTRIFYLYSRNIDASTSLTIGGILFTLTYVSLLLASGSITREERRYFIRLITKERTQKKESSGKP
jgi:stage V sporulation protein B